MIRISTKAAVMLAVLAAPTSLQGQGLDQAQGQGSVLFESYSFDPGLGFSSVNEISVPISASVKVGLRAQLTVSSGFARIKLTPSSGQPLVISGLTDSEVRLSVDILPDRLSFVLTGRAPTGISELAATEGPILSVLANDVLGFATRSLGSGGSFGGGFAGAFPVGRMALGVAGTVTQAGSFSPIIGPGQDLKPGTEMRIRAGLEGPIGKAAYLRFAGIFARRGDDQVNGQGLGVGNRFSGYASVNQPVGRSSLSIYVFDLLRADPQVESGPIGGALLPKGNIFAAGAGLTIPVGRNTRVTPRLELRRSDQALSLDSGTLEKLGTSLRFAAEVRQRLTPTLDGLFEAGALTGTIAGPSGDVSTSGFRIGVGLVVRP